MTFNRNAFIDFVIDHDVVGFFEQPVTLKSGRQSHWYANWRKAASDVFLLDRTSQFVLDFVREQRLPFDCFFGVPEGATMLATLCNYHHACAQKDYAPGKYHLPMGRGKPKEHGSPADRFFIGEPAGKVIVIEDVTTTGGSLLTTLDLLAHTNAEVIAAIGLTNRQQRRDDGLSVEQVLAARNVPYHALCQATDILPRAIARRKPAGHVVQSIVDEFATYGTAELTL